MAAAAKELTTDNPRASRRSLTYVSKYSETARVGAAFERYVGIDYSGAETCHSSLKGLRVYMAADDASEPREVAPPPSSRWYWTREAIAHCLVERLSEPPATVVGIDHGFSFPLRYFERCSLPRD